MNEFTRLRLVSLSEKEAELSEMIGREPQTDVSELTIKVSAIDGCFQDGEEKDHCHIIVGGETFYVQHSYEEIKHLITRKPSLT